MNIKMAKKKYTEDVLRQKTVVELNEAKKKLKVPVEVYPAITKNPPRQLEDDIIERLHI